VLADLSANTAAPEPGPASRPSHGPVPPRQRGPTH
jgi:hypothetical protein